MITVFVLSFSQVEAQHCVWFGECGESEKVPGKKYNCNYTGLPIPLKSEGYDLLTVHAVSWWFCPVIADIWCSSQYFVTYFCFPAVLYFALWKNDIKETSSFLCLHAGALSWVWLWKPKPLLWCWPVAHSQRESPAAPSVPVSVCTAVTLLTNEAHDMLGRASSFPF